MNPVAVYGAGLESAVRSPRGSSDCHVRYGDGALLPLGIERWIAGVSVEEKRMLAALPGPVIDVGCGPGRHLAELRRARTAALGVDIAPVAVRMARRRGVRVLEQSIFERLPGEGLWGSALLLDGNIGIGGDPRALLCRLADLLVPCGQVVVEVEPPGLRGGPTRARIQSRSRRSAWFPWARIGVDDLPQLADATGFGYDAPWRCSEERWFARLSAPGA